jgi:hypothetical protein
MVKIHALNSKILMSIKYLKQKVVWSVVIWDEV